MATLTTCTLLDVIQTVSDYAASEAEVVATVAYLINSGKVLLGGNLAGARIDLSVPACAAPQSPPHHSLSRPRFNTLSAQFFHTLIPLRRGDSRNAIKEKSFASPDWAAIVGGPAGGKEPFCSPRYFSFLLPLFSSSSSSSRLRPRLKRR